MSTPPRPLAEGDLEAALPGLDGWILKEGRLEREFVGADFVAALAWVNAVAGEAEAMGHHPDIEIRYRRVRLSLTTHDCGGKVTDWDVALAARLDRLWRSREAAGGPGMSMPRGRAL
jgi:4a-hydroxytetrahydrobiopterin dehydratase